MITSFGIICGAAIAARWLAQFWLEQINQRHVRAHAGTVPEAFRDVVDPPTYTKSVNYTLAGSRFHIWELVFDTLLLVIVLFSGVLPWFYEIYEKTFGSGAWAESGYLLVIAISMSLPGLPLAWYEQFHLEAQFGFNTTTPKIWWTDHLKGILLGIALGWPLLALIIKCVEKLGNGWWVYAWACVVLFQLIMMIVAPILIIPLFNKLTPLPEGELRNRLLALAERAAFPAKDIQVMDGSKRSRHSNAFFTGIGRFRKIVLFDTLIEQLTPEELEGVLAHEIGHYKKRHVLKMMLWSTVSLLVGFWILSILAQQEWFLGAFGFAPGHMAPALLLFGMLSGLFTFWFSPIANQWSRRYEYQADAYASQTIRGSQPLIRALRKLNEKNLSNLTPHPIYSAFYYSHPALIEREQALLQLDSKNQGNS